MSAAEAVLVLTQDQHGLDRLAPIVVRNAEHASLLHSRVARDHLLHFGRVDIFAAALISPNYFGTIRKQPLIDRLPVLRPRVASVSSA
jgi:hypothetical protein